MYTTRWEHYCLWGAIVLIILALRSLLTAVERLREEVEEFRQFMMGEKRNPDPS
jgi:hypothetical protein